MFDKYDTKEDFSKAMHETEKKLQKLEKDLEKINHCFNKKYPEKVKEGKLCK